VIRRRLPRRLQHGEEAALVDHLGELRARLLIVGLAVGAAFAFTFAFHAELIELLTRPLPEGRRLVTFGVTEPFFTAIKVSLAAAVAVALPVLLHQLWSFLAPAVHENSQRVVTRLALLSTVLFAGGLAFAYVVVLPRALGFLTQFDAELYDVQIRAAYYYSFVVLALLGMALVFQLPVFILGLVRLRVVDSAQLRRNRRIAMFLMVVVAVALPTVDPVSLVLETVPMLLLFELSIWLAVLMERRMDAAEAATWPVGEAH